jgi:rod shape-determining protein MreC
LTDKDQAIPVQVLRNGLRSVAYGRGQSGVLDLRFMAANADIQKGDALVTSGIDGVYPPGLAVASVLQVETKSTDAFAHIVCLPAAGVDRHKQLLILLVEQTVAPRPDPEGADKADKLLKRRFRDSAKDGEAVPAKDAPSEERKGQAPTAAPAAAAAPAATATAPAAKPAAATPAAPATAKPAAAAATSAAPAATQPAKSTR